MNDWLAHFGILGMKWGIRRYQNPDGTRTEEGKKRYGYSEKGGTISKGQKLYRVSLHKNDPTFDNKKYVSVNKDDHQKWKDYLSPQYKANGRDTYDIEYVAKKDLKVASATEVGKLYVEKFLKDDKTTDMTVKDFLKAYEWLTLKPYDTSSKTFNIHEMSSIQIAAQSEVGKEFCKNLLNVGVDAIPDIHGQNVSEDPVIVLAPDKKLKRVSSTKIK